MNTNRLLEAARQTLTLMTASRMAAGMNADEAFQSALAAFLTLCDEGR